MEEQIEIKKVKKIKPMFTAIVTTMERYEKSKIIRNIIHADQMEGSVKEYQRVLAVGDSVRGIKVGDIVKINPIRYGIKKHKEGTLKDGVITDNPYVKYNIPTIELDGKECMLIEDRDISYVIEEYE